MRAAPPAHGKTAPPAARARCSNKIPVAPAQLAAPAKPPAWEDMREFFKQFAEQLEVPVFMIYVESDFTTGRLRLHGNMFCGRGLSHYDATEEARQLAATKAPLTSMKEIRSFFTQFADRLGVPATSIVVENVNYRGLIQRIHGCCVMKKLLNDSDSDYDSAGEK